MKTWFETNRILTLFTINFVGISLLIIVAELLLRTLYPSPIGFFGLPSTRNGAIYGWGIHPKQLIKISDPDSCAVSIDRTNSHGWRDLERDYENSKRSYRILALGDSHTFGAIVPAEKIYTRILERKLRDVGYNVEVISVALNGWGTDQELEALVNEGLMYKPNLIILQFSTNDLWDNAYFYNASKPGSKVPEQMKGYKPFYYEVADSNELLRKENPHFHRSWTWDSWISSNVIKLCINNSEILKRLYQFSPYHNPCNTVYKIGKNQLDQLQFLLNLDEGSHLYKLLQKRLDTRVTSDELKLFLNSEDDQTQKIAFKVFEDRLHHKFWLEERYFPQKLDINSYEWRLFLALAIKIKQLANAIHAELVIFPVTDEMEFKWHADWYRHPDTQEAKENFLSPIRAIREIMPHHGIKVVNSSNGYERARNDSHVTIKGNESMAEDLYKFLKANYTIRRRSSNVRE
ncbi:MAG: SGNH/GDSL hydrolase family protein [Desulfomonilaceae bacterium]|jgi:hypothetical protein